MQLIVGLGNPGKRYAKTRHNVGFVIVDALRSQLDAPDWKLSKKFNAKISQLNLADKKIILSKPMTFMNRSGEAVGLIMHYYKIKPENLTVIHDDKDLPLGEIKMQSNRGNAGHQGVKSIMDAIGTKKFTRVRVGIASENEKKMEDTAKFVLDKFRLGEKKKVREVMQNAVLKLKKIIES